MGSVSVHEFPAQGDVLRRAVKFMSGQHFLAFLAMQIRGFSDGPPVSGAANPRQPEPGRTGPPLQTSHAASGGAVSPPPVPATPGPPPAGVSPGRKGSTPPSPSKSARSGRSSQSVDRDDDDWDAPDLSTVSGVTSTRSVRSARPASRAGSREEDPPSGTPSPPVARARPRGRLRSVDEDRTSSASCRPTDPPLSSASGGTFPAQAVDAAARARPVGPSPRVKRRPSGSYSEASGRSAAPYSEASGRSAAPYSEASGRSAAPYSEASGRSAAPYSEASGRSAAPYSEASGRSAAGVRKYVTARSWKEAAELDASDGVIDGIACGADWGGGVVCGAWADARGLRELRV